VSAQARNLLQVAYNGSTKHRTRDQTFYSTTTGWAKKWRNFSYVNIMPWKLQTSDI